MSRSAPVWPALLGLGRAPLDIFCCTNAVNYTVAVKGVLAQRPRPAVLLVETRRFRPLPVPGVWQWRLSVGSLRLLNLLTLRARLGTVFVPHQKVSRRFAPLLARAQAVAYLDDGLDTLRLTPRNFDLAALPPGRSYFSFSDYDTLPPWLGAMQVQAVCALADMVGLSPQPALDLAPFSHVFIESPGLDPRALATALGVAGPQVLVIRHPIEAKRGPLPTGCTVVLGNSIDTEGSLLTARGKVLCFGETMAYVFARHGGLAAHNTIWLQLGDAQWRNLHALGSLTPVDMPGVAGRLGLLQPAA